mgnify:CR=1 FL=1
MLVILAGYFGSMVESLGDYAATCAVAGETYRVEHMNRGIFAEGLGSAVAACLGGMPCTSYTQNIGIIATLVNASILVAILWEHIPSWKLLVWLTLIVLVSLIRSLLNRSFAQAVDKAAHLRRWHLLLVVGLYIVMHGHLTPGGGFQGGVILAAAFFLPLLARPSQSLSHAWMSAVEGIAGASFILIGLIALWGDAAFLTPLLAHGGLGDLVSGGTLPLLYLAVGLKVGAELAGLLDRLAGDDEVAS